MPTSKHIVSFSDEVAEVSPNVPAPRFVSPPVPSKRGSPPDYYAPIVAFKNRQQNTSVAAGRLPEEIYTSTLPSWRAAVRRQCLAVVERESEIIAHWQSRVRTPWLDTYFLHSSMLGTHTFFLVFLPAFFFFGHDDLGRGLCYALAFGVYMSSYLKDLVCSPRPYAPPVVRLTVGNHHLEYGLPSTHSTNSTSMALFLGAHVYDLHRLGSLSTTAFATWVVVLFIYVFSIVVGRLYTGMHGFMDCSVGIVLGIISWLLQHLVMPEQRPLVVTVVCLSWSINIRRPLMTAHASRTAIAFASVILGIITSFWCSKRVPALNTDLFTSVTPGAALDSPAAITTWVLFALLKLVTGVLIIFSWRILAKPSVQTLLPPLFRWLAWASPVRLPHRRHYTPATEYVHGPPHTLRAVPSMIDLDLAVAEVVDEDAGVASGRRGRSSGAVKRRGSPSGSVQEKAVTFEEVSEGGTGEDGEVKHYDADVLTKVVVYVGIGAIATVMVPALFEALGWGV
ncbi:hypothetical protein EDB86DRAFT_3098618 [Lactarius hatsudake]|nr:hypothetical protein EDB86DRAFT_3098618 [Lactarius hatsudake]